MIFSQRWSLNTSCGRVLLTGDWDLCLTGMWRVFSFKRLTGFGPVVGAAAGLLSRTRKHRRYYRPEPGGKYSRILASNTGLLPLIWKAIHAGMTCYKRHFTYGGAFGAYMLESKAVIWTQIFATLGIILGLVLVGYELRQTRQLTRAQLTSENLSQAIQISLARAGENPESVISKACQDQALSPEELVVFDAVMTAHAQGALRLWFIQQLSGFNREKYYLGVRADLAAIFETDAGRRWWKAGKPGYPQDFRKFGQEWMASFTDTAACRKRLALIQPPA